MAGSAAWRVWSWTACVFLHKTEIVMAKQFGIIFGCLLAGELLAMIPGVSIPGSILGMLLLTVLLGKGVVAPESIAPVCRFLIRNMAFFFVPPGVALMLYFDVIAAEWLPVTVATLVSMFLVIVATGRLHQLLHRRIKRRSGRRDGRVTGL